MRVIIVGSGPSVHEAHLGELIDDHDVVIRFSNYPTWQTAHEHYGKKTDYVVVIDQQEADILNHNIRAKEVWIFCRPDLTPDQYRQKTDRISYHNPVICYETDKWVKRFKEMGAKGYCSPRFPDEPMFGQGIAAIVYALERLNPISLTLAGFDNLLKGVNEDTYWTGTNLLTHGGTIKRMTDWETEKELLQEIVKYYGKKVFKVQNGELQSL